MLAAKGDEFSGVNLRALRPWHDDGMYRLAPLVVWHPKYRRLQHRRVALEHVFHLGGADVFTAADDHVF